MQLVTVNLFFQNCYYEPKEECEEVPKSYCYKVPKKISKQRCYNEYKTTEYGDKGGYADPKPYDKYQENYDNYKQTTS